MSENENETAKETKAETGAPARERGGPGRIVRWVVAMIAGVLAVVAVAAAVAAFYTRLELLDTDRFTERTLVIAEDAQVKRAVADTISAEIEKAIDVDSITAAASTWIGTEDPPEAIADLVASAAESLRAYIDSEVLKFLDSDSYPKLWESAVSEAHSSLVSALRGENAGSVSVDGTTLSLDLGPFIELVKERLVADGLDLAEAIPAVDAQFVLLDSDQVPQLQDYVRKLDWAADWLPWIALGLLVIAVALAPRRWVAALVMGALAAVLAGAALLALGAARGEFIAQARDADYAPEVWDAFTGGYYGSYTVMLATGVVVAALAAFALFRRRSRTA